MNCSATHRYWPLCELNPCTMTTTPRGLFAGRHVRVKILNPPTPSKFSSFIGFSLPVAHGGSISHAFVRSPPQHAGEGGPPHTAVAPRRNLAETSDHHNIPRPDPSPHAWTPVSMALQALSVRSRKRSCTSARVCA